MVNGAGSKLDTSTHCQCIFYCAILIKLAAKKRTKMTMHCSRQKTIMKLATVCRFFVFSP